MSVAIRLQRHGTKKKPFYKVVITDNRNNRDGSFIEKIGHYDPRTSPQNIKIEKERLSYWLSNGARPSSTVSALLKKVS
jgi:small subunit ribosomal protein S16